MVPSWRMSWPVEAGLGVLRMVACGSVQKSENLVSSSNSLHFPQKGEPRPEPHSSWGWGQHPHLPASELTFPEQDAVLSPLEGSGWHG